jgi:hypothetical protein
MTLHTSVLQAQVDFSLKTSLLLRSGFSGEVTDSSIEKTASGDLHINGYVWAGLLRRALSRVREGQTISELIGNYHKKLAQNDEYPLHASPLWCESSFVPLPVTDVRPGIKIDREWGANNSGALYSDEIVPPGVSVRLRFNYFLTDDDTPETTMDAFRSALWVVDEGIENIGGGWSYGHGKLKFEEGFSRQLDLKNADHRAGLWSFNGKPDWESSFSLPTADKKPDIVKPWVKYLVHVGVAQGQLLAVHMNHPTFDSYRLYSELPDTFAFRAYVADPANPEHIESRFVIPGKAFRQAILSVPIERKLRSLGETICSTPGDMCTCSVCEAHRAATKKRENSPDCKRERCNWFGSTEWGGLISISDGVVTGAEKGEILHRIQLCEHSMQNIQLFSGEYLTAGEWTHEILIDRSRNKEQADALMKEIEWVLSELKPGGKAPSGWYRLGATSTCTGAIELKEDPVTCRYGG